MHPLPSPMVLDGIRRYPLGVMHHRCGCLKEVECVHKEGGIYMYVHGRRRA